MANPLTLCAHWLLIPELDFTSYTTREDSSNKVQQCLGGVKVRKVFNKSKDPTLFFKVGSRLLSNNPSLSKLKRSFVYSPAQIKQRICKALAFFFCKLSGLPIYLVSIQSLI